MREETSTVDLSLLVAQSGWVRSLARHLVRDPDGAEDVAQETLLAALSSPPQDAADAKRLRAWLGRVAFNLAHLARRRNSRRLAREERSARSEREDSTVDTFVNASIGGLVSEAVRTLEEPYRTTVHLRYFEGLSTTEVAQRTETTNSAVRKRLWRARGKLRRQLDAKHNGERHAWFRALAPLAGLRPEDLGKSASPSGAMTVGAGWKAAAMLPVLTFGLWSGRALLFAPRPVAPEVVHAQLSPLTGGVVNAERALVSFEQMRPGPRGPMDAGATERDGPHVRFEVITVDSEPRDSAPVSHASVSGFVVDLWGNPLGGAAVVDPREPERVLGETGADGGFRLADLNLPATLEVRSPGYTTLRGARVEVESAGRVPWTQWVVVAPAVSLSGVVIDPDGRALEGATLEVLYDETAFVELPVLVDVSASRPPRVTTGVDGSFGLERVPTGAGIALRVECPGYEPRERPLPSLPASGLQIELEPRSDLATLAGVVLDEDQRPLAGVELALAGFTARSDAQGAFSMPVPPGTAAAPVASKAGYLQSRMTSAREDDAHYRIRLVMRTATSSVLGQVVDEQGKPLAGWLVIAAPPAEPVPDPVPDQSAASMVASGSAGSMGEGPAGSGAIASVRTGDDGGFRLRGLAEGSYALLGVDPETLLMTEACQVSADGAPVQLRANTGAVFATLPGRVLAQDGRPVPDALVRAELCLGSQAGTFVAASAAVRTDSRGRFELARVAPASGTGHVRLRIEHPLVHDLRAIPSGLDGPAEVTELRVDLRQAVRFSGAADSVEVLDASGRPLVLEGFTRSRSRVRLVAGRAPIQAMSQAARVVVWYRGGVEVGRERLSLLQPSLGAGEEPLSLHR